jgi:hypothetical protein
MILGVKVYKNYNTLQRINVIVTVFCFVLGFFGGSGELIASNMVGKYSTIELHLC